MEVHKSKIPTVIAGTAFILAILWFTLCGLPNFSIPITYKFIIIGLLLICLGVISYDYFSDSIVYTFTDEGILNKVNGSTIGWEHIKSYQIRKCQEKYCCFDMLYLYNNQRELISALQFCNLEYNLKELEIYIAQRIR